MKPSTMIVRAFDGTRREVMGDIELPIQIGPNVFNILFQVMDITPAYSCLLGRPWIHSAGAVPSTLHQKVKFIIENKLVVVSGEEDLLVTKPTSTPYIEVAEEALESAFQTFEIANTSYIREGTQIPTPYLPMAPMMMAKVMLKDGFQPGDGLGMHGQGTQKLLKIPKNDERFGLGYKPTRADKMRVTNEKREKRIARLESRELKDEGIPLCDIKQSFRSAGFTLPNQILAIEDKDTTIESAGWVYPCSSNFTLNNWNATEFPVVLGFHSE